MFVLVVCNPALFLLNKWQSSCRFSKKKSPEGLGAPGSKGEPKAERLRVNATVRVTGTEDGVAGEGEGGVTEP
jgi:hypothetical protein